MSFEIFLSTRKLFIEVSSKKYMINILDFILHIDKYLNYLVQHFNVGIYVILFLIILAETGFVITPFLPGDSLLFAAGALASLGNMNVFLLLFLLSLAAILGDTLNYSIGRYVGKKVFKEKSKYFKKEYLIKTEKFYEKYGDKTIVLARFMPIIRTFAPFVAGIGKMNYFKFLTFNILGGILWVFLFVLAGYFFGNIPLVKNNFTLVIIGIIILSILPGIVVYLKSKLNKKSSKGNAHLLLKSAGSSKISDQEAKILKKELKSGWKNWKGKSV